MTDNDRTYLPEVAEYERVVNEAEAEFHLRTAELNDMYPLRSPWGSEEERQQSLAHGLQYDEYNDRYTTALYAAMAGLKKSEDPLVKWIVGHCLEDYLDEALTVLRALPATVSELDDLARRESWCGEWVSFRDRAIADGVLVDELPPAERALHTWITRNLSIARYRRDELDAHIRVALAEARTLATESA